METKLNAANVKQLDERGEGQAVFSSLDKIDKDGDVTLKGAFGEQVVPLVAAHEWSETPIGKARIHEEGNEAIADFQMNLDNDLGKNWYSALLFDLSHPPAKQEYSYGFSLKEWSFGEFEGQKVRFLKQIQCHEISPVLLGAGVNTRTLNLKRNGKDPLPTVLKQAVIDKAKETGKTQFHLTSEIAEKSGIKQDLVYRMIAGEIESSGEFLQSASAILGITLEESLSSDAKRKSTVAEPRISCPAHTTETSIEIWNGAAHERRVKAGETAAYYKRVYALQDGHADPTTKSAWRFLHHFIDADGNPGKASTRACVLAVAALNGARGATTLPEKERRDVWEHLARHIEDAEMTPPILRASNDGSKVADELSWLIWDAEACIERLQELKEMRAKPTMNTDGRPLPAERIEQISTFKALMEQLDNLIRRPVIDASAGEALQRFNQLRMRGLDLNAPKS
jgi:hypothetical protein